MICFEKRLQFAFNFPLIILFSTFRSATIGVKSKNHAVLLALKRASSELSAYQKKIMILDDHIGMYNILHKYSRVQNSVENFVL